jgi:hypothetical protein
MSWSNNVSGGVAPPRLAVANAAAKAVRELSFPAAAALEETFEAVSIRRAAINGDTVEVPRGFRYRARVKLPFVELAFWRELAAAFSAWRAGGRLRFWPHADCDEISYEVLPAGDFIFPYVAGKYVGYAGTLELVAAVLLPFVPAAASWNYFTAAGETGYAPAELTHFTDADEEDYASDELSHFSPARAAG